MQGVGEDFALVSRNLENFFFLLLLAVTAVTVSALKCIRRPRVFKVLIANLVVLFKPGQSND